MNVRGLWLYEIPIRYRDSLGTVRQTNLQVTSRERGPDFGIRKARRFLSKSKRVYGKYVEILGCTENGTLDA
jgi:hypothetical protein